MWPWHGPVANGAITLTDESTRPYPQPIDTVGPDIYAGPGDTHLITVPGIDPITPEEEAVAPPGGEWWAGQALITGASLYGQALRGWIYQAEDGSRWRVHIRNAVVSASDTVGEFVTRRFGEWHVEPQEKVQGFALGYGRATGADAAKVFADLRSSANGVLRLHSVSSTGRHAVLALAAYQSANVSPLDKKPRPYRFYLCSVTGTGADLLVNVSLLYDIADIRPASIFTEPPIDNRILGYVLGPEVARSPATEDGVYVGDRVTYDFATEVLTGPGGGTDVPRAGEYTEHYRWMWAVRFADETPVPVYFHLGLVSQVTNNGLQWETATQRVQVERTDGTTQIEVLGLAQLAGTRVANTDAVFETEGAAQNWIQPLPCSVTSTVSGDVVSNVYLVGSETATVGGQDLENLGRPPGALLTGDNLSRRPIAQVFAGPKDSQLGSEINVQYLLDLFSNNCMGLSTRSTSTAGSYVGALTPDGLKTSTGTWSETNLLQYGSYNPKTGQIIIAAPTPVNWI
ncbi:hypothetical protein [Halopseudomonas salina]|uniref:Minor tail protein n=1 Tax=Halopseudomonas salina TaxID=1323744 RepID=A0ABQ1P280_9GAMM|nr:hypothetical protein [Halopseudomonas salina]GGC87488.1 hypothetical protein GCM10007418_04050 [Halopseudomonas salina]